MYLTAYGRVQIYVEHNMIFFIFSNLIFVEMYHCWVRYLL